MAFDKKGALVGVVLLLVIVALVAFGRLPALVAWHKWRMESALQNAYRLGPVPRQSDYIESHNYHRQWLVDLGYFEHRTFRLKHIMTHTPEYRRCWNLMEQAFPFTGYINVESGWPEKPTPMVLEVWDRPERMPLWEKFVQEHDVPDFAQRFGPEPESGSAGR
jgi:hypothetical protein